jgi:hypothetical protein
LKPEDVWTIRLRRGLEAHKCDLVMVNLAIGS